MEIGDEKISESHLSVLLRIVNERGQMVSYYNRLLIAGSAQFIFKKCTTIFMKLIVIVNRNFLPGVLNHPKVCH